MSTIQLRNSLREARKEAGITQATLAEMVGVSRKTINTIENRIFVPSTILSLKISETLSKDVEEIFWLTYD